jgi:hypothetical protein
MAIFMLFSFVLCVPACRDACAVGRDAAQRLRGSWAEPSNTVYGDGNIDPRHKMLRYDHLFRRFDDAALFFVETGGSEFIHERSKRMVKDMVK